MLESFGYVNMSIVAIKKNVLREIQKLNKLPDSKLFLAILVAALWLLKPSTSAPFRCCISHAARRLTLR